MNPASVRARLRRERRSLPPKSREAASLAAADLIMRELQFIKARHVAFYVANDGEMDPMPLLLASASRGKSCYLPVMTDRLHRWRKAPLAFQAYHPFSDNLVTNRFGILEPGWDPRQVTRTGMLDIVFMPLVGFDRQGHRIGMGKGFYDRTLAGLEHGFRRPRLVGMAFSQQEVAAIDANPWDVTLDAIVTEKEWISTPGNA